MHPVSWAIDEIITAVSSASSSRSSQAREYDMVNGHGMEGADPFAQEYDGPKNLSLRSGRRGRLHSRLINEIAAPVSRNTPAKVR